MVAGEDLPVGPFGLQRAVEALDLAVLPGAVWSDGEVVSSDHCERISECLAPGVGPVVVGHDLVDLGDPVRGEELAGSDDEPGSGGSLLVGVDL